MITVDDNEQTIEEWLAIRKEAGLRIDPATAKVTWWWAQVVDPYGIYPYNPEADCVGREYFARSPDSDVLVNFGDLPRATAAALWKRVKAGDYDDDWLDTFLAPEYPVPRVQALNTRRLGTKPRYAAPTSIAAPR